MAISQYTSIGRTLIGDGTSKTFTIDVALDLNHSGITKGIKPLTVLHPYAAHGPNVYEVMSVVAFGTLLRVTLADPLPAIDSELTLLATFSCVLGVE